MPAIGCSACAKTIDSSVAFCPHCGAARARTPAPPAKTETNTPDPEELRRLRRALQRDPEEPGPAPQTKFQRILIIWVCVVLALRGCPQVIGSFERGNIAGGLGGILGMALIGGLLYGLDRWGTRRAARAAAKRAAERPEL